MNTQSGEFEALDPVPSSRGDCAYCDEPIPLSRPIGAEACSDGCARSLRRAEEAERKQLAESEEHQVKETEKNAALEPLGVEEIDESSGFMEATPLNRDFDRCVETRWLQGQTFIEVKKWDGVDLSDWDGDPSHPRWVTVPPTREFSPLSSSRLEQRILSHNPAGGHFLASIYQVGVKKPSLRGGPFFFHCSPAIPKGVEGMEVLLPILQGDRAQQQRQQEKYEQDLREARKKEDDHLARLLAQQERAAEQLRRENLEIRRENQRMQEKEEARRADERRFQMEQETRRIEAMQQQQSSGMSQLSSSIASLSNGSMGGGMQPILALFGHMQQASLEQNRIAHEAQIERDRADRARQQEQARADREYQMQQTQLMISLMQGKAPDVDIREEMRRAEERHQARLDALQDRYYNLLEKKSDPPTALPAASGIDQIIEDAQKFDKLKSLFGGDSGGVGDKDMFDKALDVMDRFGVGRIAEAAAKRLAAGTSDEDTEQDSGQKSLPEADAAPPANRSLPPRSHNPAPQTSTIDPSQVTNPTDLLVAASQAVQRNESPSAFVQKLPQSAIAQLATIETSLLVQAIKDVPGLGTPRARRWIQDAHSLIRQSA